MQITRLVRPMLAKKYEDRFWYPSGMFVQPKLNGIRAMYKNGMLMSRDGILWSNNVLSHIRMALAHMPANLILDGELYVHGMSLQQINSRVAVTRVDPHHEESLISYHIFDCVSDESFGIRSAELFLTYRECVRETDQKTACFVPTDFSSTPKIADLHFSNYKRLGYEGLMYRHPAAPYLLPDISSNKENRSTWLLKRKDWLDLDADIVEVCSGNNRLASTCGSLSLRYYSDDGKEVFFSAGSGLTDLERAELWKQKDAIAEHYSLGFPWRCKVQYEMLSDNGVPLKPTIIQVPRLT